MICWAGKGKVYLGFAAVLAAVLLLTACGNDADKQDGAKAVPVAVATARTDRIVSTTNVKGSIAGQTEVAVVPKTAGKVAEVHVAVGAAVKKGQTLFRVDTAELSLQFQQLEAGLVVAQANYANALKTLERAQSLFQEGAVSRQQLEQAELAAQSAKPVASEAGVALLRTQINDAAVKSPIDGVVAVCNVKVGEMASAALVGMVVVNMDQVLLQTDVTEQHINRLQVGKEVAVTISAAGGTPFAGVISEVAPAASAFTLTYPIKIRLDNPNHVIKPGMFAEADIVVAEKQNALIVPIAALVDSSGQTKVYVVTDHMAKSVAVETGIRTDDEVEIVSGLNAGDVVVVKGQYKLTDGSQISVTEAGNK